MGYVRFLIDNRLFLLAGFILSFTSSYGQTFFISLFAGDIMREFELTDGEWGGLYTLATTMSAVTMVWAGVLTDRYRVRLLSFGVMVLLAVSCLAMALIQTWSATQSPSQPHSPPVSHTVPQSASQSPSQPHSPPVSHTVPQSYQ